MKWFVIVLLIGILCACAESPIWDDDLPKANDIPQNTRVESSPDAVLSNYRLEAGDFVNIKVFGEEAFSLETRLSDAGTVSYPFLGELKLSGLTTGDVEKLIADGLKGDYLVNPKVTVTIKQYRDFFVDGAVQKPGSYPFVPGITVQKAISVAGGFTEIASRSKIYIIHEKDKTATPTRVDLSTYVKPGDIITVKESFF